MGTEYSEAALTEAAVAIQTSQTYQTGTGEALLNAFGICVDILSTAGVDPSRLGSKALAISESEAVSTMRTVAASAAFDMVKNQVSQFAENSKILVKALNEVGKVHPFIQSVSSFWSSLLCHHSFTAP